MNKTMQVCLEYEEIEERLAQYLPEVGFNVEGGYMDYTLHFEDVNADDAAMLDSLFEDDCYNNGEMGLADTLVALIDQAGLNVATAESCTGGMLASSIVDVAGASSVFYEGLITYQNSAKMDRLGVSEDTLETHGAVSAETAVEMANGLLQNAAIGVSTTGIAGPKGGTMYKPVGLVYIAVVSDRRTDVYKNVFSGSRNEVRRKATNMALFYAVQHIKNNY